MIELFLIGALSGFAVWLVFIFINAVIYARDVSWRPPPDLKWGINPRVMCWLIPIIVASIGAYALLLQYFERI